MSIPNQEIEEEIAKASPVRAASCKSFQQGDLSQSAGAFNLEIGLSIAREYLLRGLYF